MQVLTIGPFLTSSKKKLNTTAFEEEEEEEKLFFLTGRSIVVVKYNLSGEIMYHF